MGNRLQKVFCAQVKVVDVGERGDDAALSKRAGICMICRRRIG
jgi:hypothetical protein